MGCDETREDGAKRWMCADRAEECDSDWRWCRWARVQYETNVLGVCAENANWTLAILDCKQGEKRKTVKEEGRAGV